MRAVPSLFTYPQAKSLSGISSGCRAKIGRNCSSWPLSAPTRGSCWRMPSRITSAACERQTTTSASAGRLPSRKSSESSICKSNHALDRPDTLYPEATKGIQNEQRQSQQVRAVRRGPSGHGSHAGRSARAHADDREHVPHDGPDQPRRSGDVQLMANLYEAQIWITVPATDKTEAREKIE